VSQMKSSRVYFLSAMTKLVEVILDLGRLQKRFCNVDSTGPLFSRMLSSTANAARDANIWAESPGEI